MTGGSNSQGFERQVAYRVVSPEYNRSSHTYKEGDGERAPSFLLLPTGLGVNRMFIVGTLVDREKVGSEENPSYRLKINDSEDSFITYASEYNPEAFRKSEQLEVPSYVAAVGRSNVYEKDDGSVMPNVQLENIEEISVEERDYYVFQAIKHTLDRLEDEENVRKGVSEYGGDTLEELKEELVKMLTRFSEE